MKIRSTSFKLLLTIFLLSSCSSSLKNEVYIQEMKGKSLSLFYSHNINGETHPCGCRHFPLGGLPQVAGLLHHARKGGEVIYIDSGDTLFPSSVLPKSLKSSLTFAARNLASGLDKIGLNFFTPGDQDFAAGIQFLVNLSKSVKFKFLISNLTDSSLLNHLEIATIKQGPHKIFLLGLVDPETLRPRLKKYFTPVLPALKASMIKLNKLGYDKKNPLHRLIVASHSGMEKDKEIAKFFPEINWIIGAHNQSFTTHPYEEGKVKMVQVLSRNHYLGEIHLDLSKDSSSDTYKVHEIRDKLAGKYKNNPFIGFIDNHKKKLSQIQLSEQELQGIGQNQGARYNTVSNCIECHQKQTDFWQGTAHSLAFMTLVNSKEENNLTCIKCHSFGLNKTHGFYRKKDMVLFDKRPKESLSKKRENYWKIINKKLSHIKSVRALDNKSRRSASRLWLTHDEANQVTHNFSGVQCLNCHDKNIDHPFKTNEQTLKGEKLFRNMKKKCIDCHTKDQSPQWYKESHFGPRGDLDEMKLLESMKSVACPKS